MKYKIDRVEMPPLEKVDLRGLDLSSGVSVMLPAFNEEGNMERAIKSSLEMLSSTCDNYEVLVVNDASTDRTGEIADALARNNSHVRVVHHQVNQRLGGAMRTGFSQSTKRIVFYCDADNPVDMWDVKRSLPLMKNYDLISGYRINRDESLKRKVYSSVYNLIVRLFFISGITDANFAFKLIKRDVLDQVELHCTGGFIDGELISEALRKGFKVAQVGVRYYPRTAGVSTMASPSVILEIMKEMWNYWKRSRKQSSSTPTTSA